MPRPTQPRLRRGRVYRTSDLSRWGANPARLARRLAQEGILVRLAGGLFLCPRKGRFGSVPPSDEDLVRALVRGGPFVITGPERWNALGLGSTSVSAATLVYNTRRSGEFTLGGRRFLLRRVGFPKHPGLEWFVVDLVENREMAGVTEHVLEERIIMGLRAGRLDLESLREAARRYGTRRTQSLIERAAGRASEAA